jgi:WD40 repeat protein
MIPFKPGHQQDLRSVVYSPDGNVIVSLDDQLAIVSDNPARSVIALRRVTLADPTLVATISRTSQFVATAGRDGTVKIWEARSGRRMMTLRDLPAPVLSLAFGDDTRLHIACRNGAICTFSWDVALPKYSVAGI